nr:zinc-binding dehydrogenase [Streptomyces wuyuanensis]
MAEAGRLVFPIDSSYPLADVRAAYNQLAERPTRGKIVLPMSRAAQPAPTVAPPLW